MRGATLSAGSALSFVATWLLLELCAPLALAQAVSPQPMVTVRVKACSEPFELALRRMLAIELGSLLADARSQNVSTLESIEIACDAEKALISARGVGGGQSARNDLRFDAFPRDAAPRAVALAALEALRAVDPSLSERLAAQRGEPKASLPPAAAAAASPAASAPAPQAPDNSAGGAAAERAPQKAVSAQKDARSPSAAVGSATRLTLGPGMRHFVSAPATTLLGARLELSRRFRAPIDVGLDLDAALSRQRVPLGRVEARMLSTAAWLAARVGRPDWSVSAGLGGRFGLVNLEGAPALEARGRNVLRPLVGPLLLVRVDGTVGSFVFAVAGEGGYALAGVEGLAGGATALRLDGLWVALSANAGVRLPL